MAAAAILNLLLLFILVKCPVSGGSRLHCCKISFIYVNWRPSYCCWCKNPRWLFVQKSQMVATAILNYNFVMPDHPRSPFVHLKFPFKFCVDRVRTFCDIVIRKFHKFGLKCLFLFLKIMFLGSFDTQTLFFIIKTPKRPYLTWKQAF